MSVRPEYRDKSPVYSRREAERRNIDAGYYFFEPATLKFFASRIGDSFYANAARRRSYFVTSEQFRNFEHTGRRLYTVRAICWDTGKVLDVSGFQAFESNGVAQRRAKAWSDGAEEPTKAEAA